MCGAVRTVTIRSRRQKVAFTLSENGVQQALSALRQDTTSMFPVWRVGPLNTHAQRTWGQLQRSVSLAHQNQSSSLLYNPTSRNSEVLLFFLSSMLYLTSDGALQLQEHTAPVFGREGYREKGRWGEFRDQGRLRKTEAVREGGADCS